MRKVPTRQLILASMMLAGAGCVNSPPIVTTQSAGCASLLPSEWKQPLPPPPIPDGATVGDWIGFSVELGNWGQKGYDRAADTIGIVSRCEARDAAAVKRASKGFFGRLFG